jgi:hypothetical protein
VSDATCAAGFAKALLEFAVSHGAPRSTLLTRADIDPVVFDDVDARLPFASYVALMRAAKAATRDDALSLHFG